MIHASVMTGHSARRWTVLATHGELNEDDPLEVPHPFAWAAFGLTGVGR